MMRQLTLLLIAAAVLCAVLASSASRVAVGQATGESSAKPDTPKKKSAVKPMPSFTRAREAAAQAFVRQHHPELAGLLVHLKENDFKEYQRAIRDLFRTSERLAVSKEKSTERYELDLKAWKLKSRVQLLAARLQMTPRDKKLRSELERTLTEQILLRQNMLKSVRERLAERLKKLNAQIERGEQNQAQAVKRQLQLLIKETKKVNTGPNDKTRRPNKANDKAATQRDKSTASSLKKSTRPAK